ncbi:MAG: LUD domain-containing protein [Aigarchaeota archaeon]|nr:LUD domain-containing protein [Aigarchaeota archaeon]
MSGRALQVFAERFSEQGGRLRTASGHEAVLNALIEELRSSCGRRVCIATPWDGFGGELLEALKAEFEVIGPRARPREIASCDAGITFPVAAVAETGSILEINFDDSDRLVSSLPPLHLAILKGSSVLERLVDVAPLIREASRRNFAVTLISGPSRTGDIELRLVMGVHGPHSTVVVVEV